MTYQQINTIHRNSTCRHYIRLGGVILEPVHSLVYSFHLLNFGPVLPNLHLRIPNLSTVQIKTSHLVVKIRSNVYALYLAAKKDSCLRNNALKIFINRSFFRVLCCLLWIFKAFSTMAEHEEKKHEESFMDKIADKIRGHDSSSDSDDDKPSESSIKAKVFRLFGREKPVHHVFGGGKSADIFLWRNKKISATTLGVATAIWVLFELLEYNLLTLVCHLLILALALLFLWSNGATFINKSAPRIPEVQIPKDPVIEFVEALRFEINRAFSVLRDIASGRDLKKFLSVIAGLWVLSVVGSWCNFLTLFYIVFVLLHTVPVLYEKYEDKIDPFAEKAMHEIKKQYAVFDEKVLSKVLSKIPRGPLKEKKKD